MSNRYIDPHDRTDSLIFCYFHYNIWDKIYTNILDLLNIDVGLLHRRIFSYISTNTHPLLYKHSDYEFVEPSDKVWFNQIKENYIKEVI